MFDYVLFRYRAKRLKSNAAPLIIRAKMNLFSLGAAVELELVLTTLVTEYGPALPVLSSLPAGFWSQWTTEPSA